MHGAARCDGRVVGRDVREDLMPAPWLSITAGVVCAPVAPSKRVKKIAAWPPCPGLVV
jgi:hypothetical protein